MPDSLNNEPLLIFLAGVIAVLALAVPLMLWLGKRLSRLEADNTRLTADVEQGLEILVTAPDGLFLWDHRQGQQKCSRRLAVLLALDEGTGAQFHDVLAKFAAQEARALEQAVEALHRSGKSFDLLLKLGQRTLRVPAGFPQRDAAAKQNRTCRSSITNRKNFEMTSSNLFETPGQERYFEDYVEGMISFRERPVLSNIQNAAFRPDAYEYGPNGLRSRPRQSRSGSA